VNESAEKSGADAFRTKARGRSFLRVLPHTLPDSVHSTAWKRLKLLKRQAAPTVENEARKSTKVIDLDQVPLFPDFVFVDERVRQGLAVT
jgi:hypothetical protein